MEGGAGLEAHEGDRITSYNVCYTKLLRLESMPNAPRVPAVDLKKVLRFIDSSCLLDLELPSMARCPVEAIGAITQKK